MSDNCCIPSQSGFNVNEDGSITVDDLTIPPPPVPALTCEAAGERLIIEELAVRDFKSYAGDHIIGPLNKNFSCIVGPNGSGKSNVIDALLFVFGYRAQKIRSKKVSVLIHNSHKYPDLNSCSVTVKFAMIKDEGKSYTVLPESRFYVTRTGYKDNSSTYEINGRHAQYKDVSSLLRKYGIDLDYNRFMILQGEIELISMMKPKALTEQEAGMLEYIEDIIGSNRFIKPIQHFHSKVEEVNESRIEKLNQFKLVEKDRAEAEKPRNKALEYLRLANKVIVAKNAVLQFEIRESKKEEEELTETQSSLNKKMDDLKGSVEGLQSEKDIKEMELRDISSAYEDQAKVFEELKHQFTDLEKEDAACRENIKSNKEKCKKISKSLETEESKVTSLRKKPSVLQGEIEELSAKKEVLNSAIAKEEEKLAEVMGSVKDEIKGFQDEKDSLETELIGLKDAVNEKKSELDLAQSELDLILSSEKKEKENLDSLQADHEKIVSLITELDLSMKETSKRLPEVESELENAKKELVMKQKREVSLMEEIKTKRIKVDEAKNSLMASVKRSTLVKAFMDQKKKGKLMGVFGRLGDLGAIDSKYDVAISTACGPLDNIVTDSMATAQECVEFLKVNNLGYTTFIPLDKMKKWEAHAKQKIVTPENVPRLFDLISVKDQNILPAFYYALTDTLVAKDLDQATRVGLQGTKRYRVVTLKGELVDKAGTMSGGGGQPHKGRMGNCVSDNSFSNEEVEKMNEEIKNLVNEHTAIKESISSLKELLEEREKELTTLQHSEKKSRQNYNGYMERRKMFVKQIEEQKAKVIAAAPDRQRIAEVESKIKKHEKNFNKATSEASVIENKVKELQEQILSITKGKYGSAQKKVEKLKKEADTLTQNITKNTALLKTTEKNLSKAEAKITSLKEELETCQSAIETYKSEFKNLEGRGLEVTEEKKKAEDALLVIQLQKSLIAGQVKELSTKMHESKTQIIDLKNQIKMLDIDVKQSMKRTKALNDELSKLELHDTDDGSTTLPTLSEEELNEVSVSSYNHEIGMINSQIKDMNPDLGAIAEFKRKEELFKAKAKDLEEVTATRDYYRQQYENLRKHRLQEFMRGFNIITLKVKELYQMMTLGGDAELELVDSVDPFSEGIEYSVRPLRKSWKSIRNLSGGEKTLSSLSLVFALHFYRTTPFFVMDEIDAALDFRNVSIIGSYIKDCTRNAQFIVISLRENMFLLADHLIGIYKTNDRTKNVYISPPQPERENPVDKSETTKIRKSVNATQRTSFDELMTRKTNNFSDNIPENTDAKVTEIEIEDLEHNDSFVINATALPQTPQLDSSRAVDVLTPQFLKESNKENERDSKDDRKSAKKKSTKKSSHRKAQTKETPCTVDRSHLSRAKTPKRKFEVDESQWSEDEDFIISTPSVVKKI